MTFSIFTLKTIFLNSHKILQNFLTLTFERKTCKKYNLEEINRKIEIINYILLDIYKNIRVPEIYSTKYILCNMYVYRHFSFLPCLSPEGILF